MRKWIVMFLLLGASAAALALSMRPAKPADASARDDRSGDRAGATSRPARAPGWLPRTPPPPLDPELDALFARLFQAPDEAAYQNEVAAIYFELVSRIGAHPQIIAALEAMLKTGDRDEPAVRIAVGALAGAGTPAAQSALMRLLEARKDDATFLDLLVPTMGMAKRPTPALQDSLRQLARSDQPLEVRQMAHLAMGTSAAQLHANEPARARGVVEEYDLALRDARSAEDIGTYLSVLGNAGTADAGRCVERYLADPRAEVRDQAVKALRRVPTGEAEADLTRALREDGDEGVRASAAWALSYRHPSPAALQAQADLLAEERNVEIAGRLLQNLWGARGDDRANTLTAVSHAAEAHPLAEIRERARTLLDSSPPDAPQAGSDD